MESYTITKKKFAMIAVKKGARMTFREFLELPDMVIIWRPFRVAPDTLKRWMWVGEYNGIVRDYHRREVLIKAAERDGLAWAVGSLGKNGITIISSSQGGIS